MATLSLCSNIATRLLTCMTKNRFRLSVARGLVASASACSAPSVCCTMVLLCHYAMPKAKGCTLVKLQLQISKAAETTFTCMCSGTFTFMASRLSTWLNQSPVQKVINLFIAPLARLENTRSENQNLLPP